MTLPIAILLGFNIFLLIIFIVFLLRYKSDREKFFSAMEDFDIVEFHENLKLLVEEVKHAGEKGLEDIEKQRKETDKQIIEAEVKIKELRFLLEGKITEKDIKGKTDKTIKTIISTKKNNFKTQPVKLKQTRQEEKDNTTEVGAMYKGKAKFDIPDNKTSKAKSKSKYEYAGGLLKQGMESTEISKITGLSMAEIQLIKNIKKQ
ncbi:MAG: hypothetical protein WCJ46_02980 [bacterium]